jgi:hypothetical protein
MEFEPMRCERIWTWASNRLVDAAGTLAPEELTREFGTTDHSVLGGDSGEAERIFRRESERHSGTNPNTIGA